ncbi:oxidoreductase [Euryarchaeota archaeon]|nr:oxidoreductase [Euryarchaeota archaeon]MDB2593144.1 oxidoreductase [Euryarchaeota archaeon]
MKKIGIKWKAQDVAHQSGKIAVVTGSNTGIGFQVALILADKGAHVVLACRNLEKAETAREKMLKSSPHAQIFVEELDLADLSNVEAFATRLKKSYQHVDILINNAGVMIPPQSTTKDGFELQIGTNHFGHFALTLHLMPLLSAAEKPRIVTLSSIAHWSGVIDLEDINGEKKKYNKWGMYSQSKLANLLFALELDRRLKAAGSHIESFGSHPGYSNTDLQRYSLAWRILNPLFGIQPIKGAAPTLYAATEPDAIAHRYWGPIGLLEARGWTGKAKITSRAADEEMARKLWEYSESLLGIHFQI